MSEHQHTTSSVCCSSTVCRTSGMIQSCPRGEQAEREHGVQISPPACHGYRVSSKTVQSIMLTICAVLVWESDLTILPKLALPSARLLQYRTARLQGITWAEDSSSFVQSEVRYGPHSAVHLPHGRKAARNCLVSLDLFVPLLPSLACWKEESQRAIACFRVSAKALCTFPYPCGRAQ